MLLTDRPPSIIPNVSVENGNPEATELHVDQLRVQHRNNQTSDALSRNIDTSYIDYSIRPRIGTGIWHPWKLLFPRRSILGGYVWGVVWRRTNGRRWLYKKFDYTHAPSLSPIADEKNQP